MSVLMKTLRFSQKYLRVFNIKYVMFFMNQAHYVLYLNINAIKL